MPLTSPKAVSPAPAAESYSINDLSATLGKSAPYLRTLQIQIGIHVARKGERYSQAYCNFMRKIVALRAFNVPADEIAELFAKEKKILELLHVDAMSTSPLWYLGSGDNPVRSDQHLLLTGQDLGFSITAGDIQCNLDFRERNLELFKGHDMGEDVRRVLDLYLSLLRKVDARVRAERTVLLDALDWAGRGLLP